MRNTLEGINGRLDSATKNSISNMYNILEGINGRLDSAEQISDLEDRVMEATQVE